MIYYLAIDIGASSGRHILAHIYNHQIEIEEVYRFKNNVEEKEGHFYWNIDYLFEEIKKGILECVKQNKAPKTIGIDTWAVDYALLDAQGKRLSDIHAYRDSRTQEVLKSFEREELYKKTGIQFQPFNTIYQLASEPELIKEQACDFLMVPDYLHYLLTGQKVNEYTNMSTTQLLDCQTSLLDQGLVDQTGCRADLFEKMVMPGTCIGPLTRELQEELGLKADVVVPATHDTGSAYMAAIEKDSVILSSGTWSLLGIETLEPIVTKESREANFTNEGGYDHRYRFLKNIMGLWIIQEIDREFEGEYSFSGLVDLARTSHFEGLFDVNDERFLKPQNMMEEIMSYFAERGESVPQSIGELSYCIYHSLAHSYKEAIDELEKITQKSYKVINIIGGGCQNELLNEMIAQVTGKKVVAGPIEATALGNILSQLISDHQISDLLAGRDMIRQSFEIKEYGGKENE